MSIEMKIDSAAPIKRKPAGLKTKRRNDALHKEKLKRRYDELGESYPCPVIYVSERYIGGHRGLRSSSPIKKPYYKRYYRSNGAKNACHFFKRVSNRRVRRYNGEISNGGSYKKCFDYKWSID